MNDYGWFVKPLLKANESLKKSSDWLKFFIKMSEYDRHTLLTTKKTFLQQCLKNST